MKDKVFLLPENNIIGYIMGKYGSMLTDGMGGISPNGIEYALVLEDIEDKALITQKLLIYLRAAIDTQHEENLDG